MCFIEWLMLFNNIYFKNVHAILFGMLLCMPIEIVATTKEEAVKAGFIYNFTKFVVWPSEASTNDDFKLCIIGNDKFVGGLDALKGKLVAAKKIVVHHVAKDEVNTCQMAFIASSKKINIKKTLKKLAELPILTVSDSPEFIRDGGMIGLIRDGRHVAFEVNVTAANAAGIYLSAQLLKLAKTVKDD